MAEVGKDELKKMFYDSNYFFKMQVAELAKLEDSAQKQFWAIKTKYTKNMYYPKRN